MSEREDFTPEAEVPNSEKVLITGGTDGIGRAIAEQFIELNKGVAVCGKTPETVEEMSQKEDIHAYLVDLSDRREAKALVDKSVEDLGGIDTLVLNAAMTGLEQPGETEEEKQCRKDSVFMVNEVANVAITREALDQLIESHGTIAFITSGLSKLAEPPVGAEEYYKSKKKMEEYFADLSKKVGDQVKIFSINPGMVDTKMQHEVIEHGMPEVAQRSKYARDHGLFFPPELVGQAIANILTKRLDFDPETGEYDKEIECGSVVDITSEHINYLRNKTEKAIETN